MSNPGRTLPHSPEAEAAVLAGILLSPKDAINKVLSILQPDDFYAPANQDIYEGILQLEEKGRPIDIITLEEVLAGQDKLQRAGGIGGLAELSGKVATAQNISFHAKIVRDKATLRRLIQISAQVAAEGYNDPPDVQEYLDEAEGKIFELAQRTDRSAFFPVKPILKDVFKNIQARHKRDSDITGVPSGYPDFDKLTAGLQPGDLIIVGARPSMGKTSFCINIAHNAAMDHNVPCLIFSLEMSKESLVERVVAAEAQVNSRKLRAGSFDDEEWKELTAAAGRIAELPIFIDDSAALTVLEIRAKSRRFRHDRSIFPAEAEEDEDVTPMGLIIIDYLQLVRARKDRDSREREVAEVSRGLKALAKDVKLPVIALSQLRRAVEDRKDSRPQLSDLRESGAIEQDADLIAFIHRARGNEDGEDFDPTAPIPAELIIGKQRNGPLGDVELVFLPKFTRFESRARHD